MASFILCEVVFFLNFKAVKSKHTTYRDSIKFKVAISNLPRANKLNLSSGKRLFDSFLMCLPIWN